MLDRSIIPLCHHIKDDGVRCGSPALRGKVLCYFHLRQRRLRPARYIPILEDRPSIQFAATQIVRAVLEDKVDAERLRLMLYALQIATSNLKYCDLPGSNPDVLEPRPQAHAGESPASTPEEVLATNH